MKQLTPQKITEAYLAALFFLLPLGLHHTYYDITETKTVIFAVLTLVYVLASLLCLLRNPAGSLSPGARAFALFALLEVSASLLFGDAKAFLGADNRYQGVLVFALYALSFCFCSLRGRFGMMARIAAFTALALVSLLALLQSFGLDPLSLWEGLRDADRGRYLSTLGNVNFLGAYLALLLPLCAGRWCESGRTALLPLLSLASCALLCGSDAGVLGALGGLLLLFTLCGAERERLRAFGAALAVLGLSVLLYGLLLGRFGLLSLSPAGKILASPWVSLPLTAVGTLLWKRGEALRRPWLLPACLTGLGLLALLLANLCPERIPPEMRSYLVFSPAWGSDRGAIWSHVWECYRSQGPLRQLLGSGSGALARYDLAHRLFPDTVVDSAHNEYLHYLLTAGALGLGAYLFTLYTGIRKGIRLRSSLTAGVFGCVVQGLVNIAQCTTTPLLLMLLALLCGGNDSCEEREKQL